MAKQSYYHVRVALANGQVCSGSTFYGLSKAVEQLSTATGQQWPYQIINRGLKSAPLWASAFVQDGVARICSIELAASSHAALSPYGREGIKRLGQPVLPPDANPVVSPLTPLDVLISQAAEVAKAPCWLCKKLVDEDDLAMGVCRVCIDTPPPLK